VILDHLHFFWEVGILVQATYKVHQVFEAAIPHIEGAVGNVDTTIYSNKATSKFYPFVLGFYPRKPQADYVTNKLKE